MILPAKASAAPEALRRRRAVAVQAKTAVAVVATVAMAAMQALAAAAVAAATAATAATTAAAVVATVATAVQARTAEAAVAAMALEVMEVTAPKVGHLLPPEDLPLVAVVVPLFLEILPEIARRLVGLAFALSNTTFMR